MAKVATTVDASVLGTNASATGIRAWGAAVNAAIAASGLVQTSDTGQVNWSTVSAPGASAATIGYEIWRFNDTLQSTSPIYIRIEYRQAGGSAPASGICPTLFVSIGSSTNGAGTLAGLNTGAVMGTGFNSNLGSPATNTAENLYACHTAGSFFLMLGTLYTANSNIVPSIFSVSRTVDSTGALTGDAAYLWLAYAPATSYYGFHAYIDYTNSSVMTLDTVATSYAAAAPPLGLKNYDGGNKGYVLPHYCHPTSLNPGIVVGVLTTRTSGATYGGFVPGTLFTTKPAGPSSSVSHTYIVLADSSSTSGFYPLANNWLQGSVTNQVGSNVVAWTGAAFLWE